MKEREEFPVEESTAINLLVKNVFLFFGRGCLLLILLPFFLIAFGMFVIYPLANGDTTEKWIALITLIILIVGVIREWRKPTRPRK